MMGKEIWEEAKNGNPWIIKNLLCDKIRDGNGWTPLHYLASRGVEEILEHPSVGLVKENHEQLTPLHFLVQSYSNLTINSLKKIIEHPLIDKVTDKRNLTPLHGITFYDDFITSDWLKKKYPWFELGNRKIDFELIDEILNTQNACKFILEEKK